MRSAISCAIAGALILGSFSFYTWEPGVGAYFDHFSTTMLGVIFGGLLGLMVGTVGAAISFVIRKLS